MGVRINRSRHGGPLLATRATISYGLRVKRAHKADHSPIDRRDDVVLTPIDIAKAGEYSFAVPIGKRFSTWTPWRRRRLDDDTRAEFDTHLALLIDRYVRSGMTPEDARAQAARQFGNVTWHREEIHRMNGVPWIDAMVQDLRYAFRQLRRGPGFSAVVVGTLALGIGGTTAVFSVMHAVLLAPLPYAQADRLVRIYQEEPGKPDTRRAVSAPQFRMVRGEAASFAEVGARYIRDDLGLELSQGGKGQRLRIVMVTSDYFRTLHSDEFHGPGFHKEDERFAARREDRSGTRRVVLSNAAVARAVQR